jgi:hypothetical protein
MHYVYNVVSFLSGTTKCSPLSHDVPVAENIIEHKICVLNRSVKLSIIVFILKIIEWHFIIYNIYTGINVKYLYFDRI